MPLTVIMSPLVPETNFTLKYDIPASQQNFSDDVTYIYVVSEPSKALDLLAAIVGWAYFLSWSCAFYPQIITNCLRKSVVGLNFDFIALNFTGHITYAIFNSGLFWIPELQAEYFSLHPGGIIPVQLNDVLFSMNAVLAVLIWIIQACLYEREGQSVSTCCVTLLLLIAGYVITIFTMAIVDALTWLTWITYFSYVKLLTAVTKYSPQVYLHYKRKTVQGFSMGGVLLDLTGGSFSIIQMFIIAYNYSDWGSIVGDPTKLGLGLISVSYCLIFCVQHQLYKHDFGYEPI